MTDPPPLRTIPEAAKALGISVRGVYRLIAGGDLITCDVAPKGSRRPKSRVRQDSIDDFISRRTGSMKTAS